MPDRSATIIIRTHSNLIYWWPVWIYSAAIALATMVWHVEFFFPAVGKGIKFYPQPWAGL